MPRIIGKFELGRNYFRLLYLSYCLITYMKLKTDWFPFGVLSLQCGRFFATQWTIACQAPLSMRFSRQEYWSGLPHPPPGDLPDPEIEPASLRLLHWQAGSLALVPPGKPNFPFTLRKKYSFIYYPDFPPICTVTNILSSQLEDLKTSESPHSHCWSLLLPLQSPPSSVVKDILMLVNPQTGLPLPNLASLCSF